VAVLRGSRQRESLARSIANEDRALKRWVRKLVREAKGGEMIFPPQNGHHVMLPV